MLKYKIKNNKLWLLSYIFIIALRIVTPVLIFVYPFFITLFSFILDTVDSELAFRGKVSWRKYSSFDKALDYWWYIFIFIYSINLGIFPIILILFVLRSIGQLAFLATREEKYFVFFPNILEIYFLFYIVVLQLQPKYLYLFDGTNQFLPLLLSTLIVIPREIGVHILKVSPLMSSTYSKWNKSKI